jgi:mannose-6-phosphate isomerase-like protein (cupin superfamily)
MRMIATTGLMVTLLIVSVVTQQRTAPPPPPAPAPGSPATFKSAEALAAALKIAKATEGGMTTSNVSTTDQYSINIVHRAKPAGPAQHAGNTELHYIIEGSGTVITGGTLVRGATAGSATITNGVTQRVSKGDVLIVPANSPHWYSQIDSEITYLEVRWLAPASAK